MEDLLSKLFIAETSQDVLNLSENLAITGNASGLLQALERYKTALRGNGLEREAGLLGFAGLTLQPMTIPFLIQEIPGILDHLADKGPPVRESAQLALDRIIQKTPPNAFKKVLEGLIAGAGARKWQSKVGALKALEEICDISPDFIAFHLPEIIAVVEEVMHDTKTQVADAAKKAMRKLCSLAGNEDIEPHIEILVDCMGHPESVPDTIKKLSATTFVQDMSGPALAVMVPLLCRALNERSTAILRPTALIIDNLCKLVKNPGIL
jgi:elongation factor 3